MSCVIPIPRLPKPHSCFPTDPDSICLPSSVLTAPLGLLYSAVVPKGAFSIRDQHKPPNPLVSTLGSNWRGAQARWFNVHGQFSSVLTGTAPLGLIYSAVVPKGAFSIRDLHKPPNPQVSTLGSNWRGAQAQWLNANQQAEASGQAPILSMVLHSNVSPGVHPDRDQPSCHKPRLDKMVSAGAPHWRGAQAQWLYKCGSGCRLLLLLLIAPSDVSPGVHPHRDQPSCHKPRLDKMVSASGHQLRGTHDQWLVKRLNPVPVVIGDDFDGLFGGSALLGLKSLPHPLSWAWGRSVFGFL